MSWKIIVWHGDEKVEENTYPTLEEAQDHFDRAMALGGEPILKEVA